MPPAAPRTGSRTLLLTLALVSVGIVVARLPFLLHGSRFFDSDEAVEGLMARHVLTGEFPLFLWGQRYKGVPEVYLAAAAFHVWAPGVMTLKAVTLACAAVYACLNFQLVARLFSRRVAWIATGLLIAGPPSLVLWTLSGSADIVMTFLAGTALLLGVTAWQRTRSRAGLVLAAASLGFGLWVQQYILYYVAALAVASIDWGPEGRARLASLARGDDLPPPIRFAVRIVAAAAFVYAGLGLMAFFSLGFVVTPYGVPITVGDPQKMWWIAAALLLIAAGGSTVVRLARAHTWRPWVAPALAFLAGWAPTIVGRLLSDGPGAPRARMDLVGLATALPEFTSIAVPVLFGFRSPATEWLAVPAWAAVVVVVACVISYARGRSVFHVFAILTPCVFLISGAYIDAQSYRYLMPLHAALPVIYATGIDTALRKNRVAGAALLAALVSLFVWQQLAWYGRLQPDREADVIVACLKERRVRVAFADYWLSYKLTFLTGERVIVAPTNGVDRYPPYTAAVRAQPSAPAIERVPPGKAAACDTIVR